MTAPPLAAMAPAAPLWPRTLIWVLWPGFLLSCVIELLVFALVDPGELHWAGEALPLSRQAVYTVAFFVFWMLATATCALTVLLAVPASELNDAAFRSRVED